MERVAQAFHRVRGKIGQRGGTAQAAVQRYDNYQRRREAGKLAAAGQHRPDMAAQNSATETHGEEDAVRSVARGKAEERVGDGRINIGDR